MQDGEGGVLEANLPRSCTAAAVEAHARPFAASEGCRSVCQRRGVGCLGRAGAGVGACDTCGGLERGIGQPLIANATFEGAMAGQDGTGRDQGARRGVMLYLIILTFSPFVSAWVAWHWATRMQVVGYNQGPTRLRAAGCGLRATGAVQRDTKQRGAGQRASRAARYGLRAARHRAGGAQGNGLQGSGVHRHVAGSGAQGSGVQGSGAQGSGRKVARRRGARQRGAWHRVGGPRGNGLQGSGVHGHVAGSGAHCSGAQGSGAKGSEA